MEPREYQGGYMLKILQPGIAYSNCRKSKIKKDLERSQRKKVSYLYRSKFKKKKKRVEQNT